MKLITHFLAAGILLCAYQLGGQITTTFAPATITGAVNSTVDLQLKVSGFTNVATFQCPITYNAALLEYISADGFGLPGFVASNLANPQTPAPRVSIAYFPDIGQFPDGVTVANNTSIVTLHFKVKANGTSTINLANGVNPAIEAYNKDGVQLAINFQNGGVSVTGGTGGTGGGTGNPPVMGFQIQAHPDTVAPNEIFCMPITVNDFIKINTMQYAMHWDKTVLQYTELQGFALTDLAASNFGTNNVANGNLTLAWSPTSTPGLAGVTVANGTAIYKVCFKAIGPLNASTLITFDGVGVGTAEVTSDATPVPGTNLWTATSGVSATIKILSTVPPSGITFTADKDTVLVGGQTCVQVKVKKFDIITTAQFGMTYDPTKVTFNSFDFGANPLMLNSTTISNLPGGKITFAWVSSTGEGLSLPDNTVVYSVCFTAIGTAGTTSPFTFGPLTSPMLPVEVSNDANPPEFLNPVLNQGSIYITNATPCNISATASVAQQVKCFGGSDGAINLSTTGTPATGYSWVGPSFTSVQQNISGLKAGVYTVTVTTAIPGCTATATTTVTQPTTGLSVTSITPTHVNCNASNTGAVTLVAAGGSTPYTYLWNNGSTQQNLTGLLAGTYSVTITTATGGCTATASTTVNASTTILAMPSVIPTTVSCFGGNNGALDITITGGSGNYNYLWTSTLAGFQPANTEDLANLKAGNYMVSVTDNTLGCTFTSGPILVSQPAPISVPTPSLIVEDVKCNGGTDGSINLSPTGGTGSGTYTYMWSGPNGFTSNQLPPLVNRPAGLYFVTITDGRGCSFVNQPITVGQPTAALTAAITSTTPVKCYLDENGKGFSTVSGGTAPYSFSWKDASGVQRANVQNPTNLAAGVYTLLVTDAHNCTTVTTASATSTVQGPPGPLTATVTSKTNVKCNGGNNGAIALQANGGWGNYTVTWTPSIPGGLNPSGLTAGTYVPKIKDAEGCEFTLTAGVTITEPILIIVSNTTVQQVSCKNAADGSIGITLSGGTTPYNVVWSNGLSGTTISNLTGGSYTATVTDGNQCSVVLSPITVTEPLPVEVDFSAINVNGTTLGSIVLDPHGGTAPYSVLWDHGLPPTLSVTGLTVGTYNYTVTDAHGCMSVGAIPVTSLNPVTCHVVDTTVSCQNNGCATFYVPIITGVNTPFTFTWNGGGIMPNVMNDTAQICNLTGGVYNFTVTDALGNSCTMPPVPIFTVQPPTHSALISNPNEDFANGSIDLIPIFNGQYSYNWSTGATTQDLMNLDSGLYIVSITDIVSGCTIVDTFPLTRQWQSLDIDYDQVKPSCLNTENGSIEVFITGGRHPYIYQWSGTSIVTSDTTKKVDNLAPGVYMLKITDGNGTILEQSFSLLPQSNLSGNFAILSNYNGSQVSGATECDGKIRIDASGEVAPLTYTWSHGGNQRTEDDLCAGDWWAIVTDAAGCKDTLTGVLSAPAAVQANGGVVSNYNGYGVKCNGGNEGEIEITVSGGVVPYTVKWSTGFEEVINNTSTKSKQTALTAGDYTVTITDENGVSNSKTITVTEPDPLVVEFLDMKPTTFTQCDGEVLANALGGVSAAPSTTIIYTWTSRRDNGVGAKVEGRCAGEVLSFLAIDANGCQASAKDTVDYPDDGCRLFSPVITPGQSEGKNDFLYVTCIEEIPNNTLEIYNRWGQLVYQVEGYNNGDKIWTGTNVKDQPLPEGVYFYVLSYKNSLSETTQLKGYINLLR